MTANGLVVVDQEEDVPPIPPPKSPTASPPASPTPKRSPIADLLYMRWMEGLRIKWPGITAAS